MLNVLCKTVLKDHLKALLEDKSVLVQKLSKMSHDLSPLVLPSTQVFQLVSRREAFKYYSPELEDRLQAIDEQSLERVLALQNSTEESQIETTTDDSYVETSSIDGESEFMSYYSKDSMKFASSYRSDRSGYYRNDVVRSQWRLAAKKGNFLKFLPRELKGLIIVHKETNNIIREFHKKPGFLKTFLNTVVGRSYLRVMNDFGLLPTHIHADYSSVTISVAPDPNPIPVDQLQKAQKNLSDRLDSLNLIN